MYTIYIILVIILENFISLTNCAFANNVCPTFRDYYSIQNNSNCWYNFAAESKVPQIIQRSGYPFIEYKVQTKDGYILTVFRIPSVNSQKPPVFMLHGVQSTSAIFVSIGRNSLAFLLSDAGYDVWLGNYRGTEYSEGHVSLNASQREYWNYGADEIGLIDVPTMIQLVTYHAGHKGKIIYIGHSLGTTAAIMYATEYPDHAKDNIRLFVWISPAYKLSNMLSPYRIGFPFLKIGLRIANDLNFVQLLSRGRSQNITRPVCLSSPTLMMVCLHLLNLFLGPFSQISPETIPVYFNQLPGGTSFKTLIYLQEATRGRFNKYDYGPRNPFFYGSTTPPEYNISKIQVPVYIMYAAHDWATSKRDSINLYRSLPPSARFGIYEVRNLNFNHFDFLFGRNAKTLVYDRLMNVLNMVTQSGQNVTQQTVNISNNEV